MSAHVLLNLLNELGKSDKMRGLQRMLDSNYHKTNTLKSHFWRKNVIILSLHVMYATLLWTTLHFP